ncbi:MAG: DNA polymerase III subunit alpha [Bacteroidales bacterium]|nr:DNA polymerase III subunit alpha [Bacteroidales bacterium]
MKFSHLHVHTQFSLLDGASDIKKLFKKAAADGMPALAITDHGNMFGVFEFVAEAYNHRLNPDDPSDKRVKVKPIVGCEFYVVADRFRHSFTRGEKDQRFHQVLLAKNQQGYKNLVKLSSLGFIEGYYSKYPRIDKDLILKYHEGLIATTCCLAGYVPKAILQKSEQEAEAEFKWWLDIFGDDYYIELQRHAIPDQEKVNQTLLKWAQKYKVKVIATNDSHYTEQTDYNAHDILLCVNTGEKKSTPIAKEYLDDEEINLKNTRFGFYNDQFYFKTTAEMSHLFKDIPQAIDNTNEIVDKVELLNLQRDIMLPHFPIPEGFANQDAYLRHLTFEGARKRYHELTPAIEERLNYELQIIERMGFAGYFLIVMDFIRAGRDLGVFVGPGRGSAAGSAVAYCIGITNIDPIKYDLLFERFLNPDRKSMPDIDTDFDDEGRQKVIDYVVKKYGRNQVAQIITYGTMAAKMSIKDVGRVLELSLNETNELSKLVPERPGITLQRIFDAPIDGENGLREKEGLNADEIADVLKLREIIQGDDLKAQVLREARNIEGSVRNTGVHAAGIIIAPTDLTDIVPLAIAKDADLYVTQFEGKVIEQAGVIKMDFLGLKTLTIIKNALELIHQNHGITIDIDNIPLDDKKTFELYQRGETNGTFQFESPGMQKYLRELQPDSFNDLIAMNALYRPGPLEYIPNYIARKHGKEPITYDLPEMEEYLKDTYGITVYQEQVMLLSQKLAGFSKGDADLLRKAMGKKDRKTLDKLKPKFIEQASQKGYDVKILEKIWTDWEAFASYAFNKSHSTCYAFVAYQTAYLKAHYPAEYMAAVLNNASSIEKITFFMEECRRLGIEVLGPDINESRETFTVNKKGNIRFGLAAIKGIGEGAVSSIIEEREKNGHFKDVYDFFSRLNYTSISRKIIENLIIAGALDSFGIKRSHYFASDGQTSFVEQLMKYGIRMQEEKRSQQQTLFDMFDNGTGLQIPPPKVPVVDEDWTIIEQLNREKDLIGIYLSGHPLDPYKFEFENVCTHQLADLNDLTPLKGKEVIVGGLVVEARSGITKNNKPYLSVTLQDYNGTFRFNLFGKDFDQFERMFRKEWMVLVKAKIQPREFGNRNELEFKITRVLHLADVREELLKYVQLTIPYDQIDDDFVQQLVKNVKENPGKLTLKIALLDPANNMKVDCVSRTFKIKISNDFLNFIHSFPFVQLNIA